MAGSATTSSLLVPAVPDSPAAVIFSVALVAAGDPGVAVTWTWAQAGPASIPTAKAAPAATAPIRLSFMHFPSIRTLCTPRVVGPPSPEVPGFGGRLVATRLRQRPGCDQGRLPGAHPRRLPQPLHLRRVLRRLRPRLGDGGPPRPEG